MGADLIISALAVEEKTTLDWSQAEVAIAALSDQEITTGLRDAGFWDDDDCDDERGEVRRIFRDLQRIFEDSPRDFTWIKIRGLEIYLSGGMSWGDSPTDSSETLQQAWSFPTVLKAIGFVVDW